MNHKRTVIFYGDSNTYGFDPRDFFGGRYEEPYIWTCILEKALKERWNVLNEGMNGRTVPFGEGSLRYALRLFDKLSEQDVFSVMLGTNDILMTLDPDAAQPVDRMEQFLIRLTERPSHPYILLVAPPYVGAVQTGDPLSERYRTESIKMNEGYRLLAEKYQLLFADAAEWDVELAYDHVHFSEAGHVAFANRMVKILESL